MQLWSSAQVPNTHSLSLCRARALSRQRSKYVDPLDKKNCREDTNSKGVRGSSVLSLSLPPPPLPTTAGVEQLRESNPHALTAVPTLLRTCVGRGFAVVYTLFVQKHSCMMHTI
jgi:hypothetical protein